MSDTASDNWVVYTNKARCRDCNRCVRVCPVKAIRMHDGQAHVDATRCIACGTCIRECPQGAKSFRNDVDRAMRLVAGDGRVAASIAPSFASGFPDWQARRLPSALRRLGFDYVGETAIGAYHVAVATAEAVAAQPNRCHVCTACPSVVRYVERYRPDIVPNLAPVVSPMIAHATHLRQRLGDDIKVVFIGPCVAKKAEAERPEHKDLVDCVLTFVELAEWFERSGIDLKACEESGFDEEPEGDARLFPLEGGSVRTAGWSTDVLGDKALAVSGFDEVCAALDDLKTGAHHRIIEPLMCPQGCINGPAMLDTRNGFARRCDVLHYANTHKGKTPEPTAYEGIHTRFRPFGDDEPITEEAIRRVLEMTGKASEEDQLNCGACGYPTCRDKAIAVIRGLAEPEMCIPYMRRLAEQRTDRIIETSPNGIVILDEHLRILHMNPAFRKLFMCTDALGGQPIARLMDPAPFESLSSGDQNLVDLTAEHGKYGLVCHEILYPLRDEKQYVGIFVNITHSQASQKKLAEVRAQTIVQARELLDHQIRLAETIARALGESTAHGEDLVDKLLQIAGDTPPDEKDKQWLQDTYTSKPM